MSPDRRLEERRVPSTQRVPFSLIVIHPSTTRPQGERDHVCATAGRPGPPTAEGSDSVTGGQVLPVPQTSGIEIPDGGFQGLRPSGHLGDTKFQSLMGRVPGEPLHLQPGTCGSQHISLCSYHKHTREGTGGNRRGDRHVVTGTVVYDMSMSMCQTPRYLNSFWVAF